MLWPLVEVEQTWVWFRNGSGGQWGASPGGATRLYEHAEQN